MNRILQILIALDQLINTLFGGWADETISARAYRQSHKPRWARAEIAIDWVFKTFFGQENHCLKAYQEELGRRQVAPIYRSQSNGS